MKVDKTLKVTVDGQELDLPSGRSLLAGALDAGVYIPHLCFHRDLPSARKVRPVEAVYRVGERIENDGRTDPYPGCGLCVVEVEGTDEPVPSCDLMVAPGMVVHTNTQRVQALRKENLAATLAHYPHASLPGRCELGKVACYIGVPPETPRYRPRGLPAEEWGLFRFEPELCVSCMRCVQACCDLKGVDATGFVYRGEEMVVGRLAPTAEDAGCRFCGSCVQVCPTGALTDRVEEREEHLVPCLSACPAGVEVPRFLRAVAEGHLEEAARITLDRLPLPNVLGRVCFHPCEKFCRRSDLGGPLSVCRVRRYVFDTVDTDPNPWPAAPDTGKRVAVIGSGPAGLAAAHFLRRLGHGVTVFEAAPEPGGMLRYGIPEYRLPREVLQTDLDLLTTQGVEIRTETALGREISSEGLREEGYQAVLMSSGAGEAKSLDIEGTEFNGVLSGVDFLRETSSGSAPWYLVEGSSVLVIGGGNVAIDAARTARRLGAERVTLICLERGEEVPVHPDELRAARVEGVEVREGWGPGKFWGANGRVHGVYCVRCTSVLDDSGRFAPRFDEDTVFEIETTAVILAIGQEVDQRLRDLPGLAFKEDGFLMVDPETLSTGEDGVFASGDLVLGPSSVVRAVASGRRAAAAIDRYLGGSGEIPSLLEPEDPALWIGRREGFAEEPRSRPEQIPARERIQDFAEVEATLVSSEARAEAARCLQCDLRLRLSDPVLPPLPWLEFNEDAVASVPEVEGVYQLLGSDRIPCKIAGTPNLAQALREELSAGSNLPYFIYDEDPMYTKRESELIQQFLARHGRMPQGDDDLDDLF